MFIILTLYRVFMKTTNTLKRRLSLLITSVAIALGAIIPLVAVAPSASAGGLSGSDEEVSDPIDCEDPNDINADNCQVVAYIVIAINVLSALAGLVIVGSVMFAGYQYITAQDNASQTAAARTRIYWAVGALMILIFTYAVLQWLVPGGVI